MEEIEWRGGRLHSFRTFPQLSSAALPHALPRGTKQSTVSSYGTQSLLKARGASISLTRYKAH